MHVELESIHDTASSDYEHWTIIGRHM